MRHQLLDRNPRLGRNHTLDGLDQTAELLVAHLPEGDAFRSPHDQLALVDDRHRHRAGRPDRRLRQEQRLILLDAGESQLRADLPPSRFHLQPGPAILAARELPLVALRPMLVGRPDHCEVAAELRDRPPLRRLLRIVPADLAFHGGYRRPRYGVMCVSFATMPVISANAASSTTSARSILSENITAALATL